MDLLFPDVCDISRQKVMGDMGDMEDETADLPNFTSQHSLRVATDSYEIVTDTAPRDPLHNTENSYFELRWKEISMTALQVRKKDAKKPILSKISGSAATGQLSCILGRSGAGKTSLLSLLAGTLRSSKREIIEGDVYINDHEVSPWNNGLRHAREEDRIAFVAQQDTLLPYSTPREALTFSARMRLPSTISDSDIEGIVCHTLSELALSHVEDQYIKVLSGGEARRVSLGLELVTSPKIILIDEVTSGLDSHNAEAVVGACRKVAQDRNDVVMLMTIHQPNAAIVALMDRVTILHAGRCLYEGDPGGIESFFAERGFPVPVGTTPLDWALKTSEHYCNRRGSTHLEKSGFFAPKASPLDDPKQKNQDAPTTAKGNPATPPQRISILAETKMLFKRTVHTTVRDSSAMKMKVMGSVLMALLAAVALQGVGKDSMESPSSFSSHVGVVFFVVYACHTGLILKIMECIIQIPIFRREFATGHYRMLSFTLSTLLYDICMTFIYSTVCILLIFWSIGLQGSFWKWYACTFLMGFIWNLTAYVLANTTNDPKMGPNLIPLVMLPQFLFSGFIVAPESLPSYMKWLTWLQTVTYGFRLMSTNEFESCLILPEEEQHLVNCAKAFTTTAAEEFSVLYNDETRQTVPQAGKYVGKQDIYEYFEYFNPGKAPLSLAWNYCGEPKTQTIKVNEAGDGYCDVTFSRAERALINPQLARQDSNEDKWFRMVTGHNVRLAYSKDLRSLHVEKEDIFLPPAFVLDLYTNLLNATALVDMTCRVMEDVCPEVYAADGFSSFDTCMERIGSLPAATKNKRGLNTVDGNSTGCRQLHASLAVQSPEKHCPHLSYFPMEDKDGKVKCSDSNNFIQEDFFSPSDFNFFERVAIETGVNVSTLFEPVPESEIVDCAATGSIEPEVFQRAKLLPSNYFCVSFLESQDALGDYNAPYWGALVSLMIVTLCLGMTSMRLRVGRV